LIKYYQSRALWRVRHFMPHLCFDFTRHAWANQPAQSRRAQGHGWSMLSNPTALAHRTMVELRGIEPLTPCLQSRCSSSWATAPNFRRKFCPGQPLNNAINKVHCRLPRTYISAIQGLLLWPLLIHSMLLITAFCDINQVHFLLRGVKVLRHSQNTLFRQILWYFSGPFFASQKWWAQLELNQWPPRYQHGALPTEL
jgi:hypothetical protein